MIDAGHRAAHTQPIDPTGQWRWDGAQWVHNTLPTAPFPSWPPAAPPEPPAASNGWLQPPVANKPGRGLAIAGLTVAIVGVVFGIVPLLFYLALPFGVLGLVFGILGRRHGLGKAAIVLAVIAIGLGIAGAVIVSDAFNDVNKAVNSSVAPNETTSHVAPTETAPSVPTDPYKHSAIADATKISGVTYRLEPNHSHVDGVINYDTSPPVGGNHSQYWVDCTGTVYPNAIANENAVHGLEHGAVWITYRPDLPKADVTALTKYVSGQDRMFMSPYPGLKTNISMQSWGYQLFLDSPSDPRIRQFIDALRYNPKTTPEYGADCSQPTFKARPSTFGHPLWAPATQPQ
jgi:hypothetical protein